MKITIDMLFEKVVRGRGQPTPSSPIIVEFSVVQGFSDPVSLPNDQVL